MLISFHLLFSMCMQVSDLVESVVSSKARTMRLLGICGERIPDLSEFLEEIRDAMREALEMAAMTDDEEMVDNVLALAEIRARMDFRSDNFRVCVSVPEDEHRKFAGEDDGIAEIVGGDEDSSGGIEAREAATKKKNWRSCEGNSDERSFELPEQLSTAKFS